MLVTRVLPLSLFVELIFITFHDTFNNIIFVKYNITLIKCISNNGWHTNLVKWHEQI